MSDDKPINWKPFIWLALTVIGFWVLWLVISISIFGKPSSPGELGDLFGGINTLFSGLAFAALIFAIYIQLKEFQLQRKELELTRLELEETRKVQETNLNFHLKKYKEEIRPRILFVDGKLHLSDYDDRPEASFDRISYTFKAYDNGFEVDGIFDTQPHALHLQQGSKELYIRLHTTEKFIKPDEGFTLEVKLNDWLTFEKYLERFESIFIKELHFDINDIGGNKYRVYISELNRIQKTTNDLVCDKPELKMVETLLNRREGGKLHTKT